MPSHDPNTELPPNQILILVVILTVLAGLTVAYILAGDPMVAPPSP